MKDVAGRPPPNEPLAIEVVHPSQWQRSSAKDAKHNRRKLAQQIMVPKPSKEVAPPRQEARRTGWLCAADACGSRRRR
ncbi:MAG: hypothetical protein MHM6MM_003297 [Cercozoa sp. M6MM]